VLSGIVNGIDEREWDPARDPHLPATYTDEDRSGKAVCKAALQKRMGLAVKPGAPLLGVVARLAWMKGLDLLPEAVLPALAEGAQLVVLGTGEPALETALRALQTGAPGPGVRARGLRRGAGAPDRGGLGRPAGALARGAVRAHAAVRAALRHAARGAAHGGPGRHRGGRHARQHRGGHRHRRGVRRRHRTVVRAALLRALALYDEPARWEAITATGMRQPVGWGPAAAEYQALYEELLASR
jgi:starch synthase